MKTIESIEPTTTAAPAIVAEDNTGDNPVSLSVAEFRDEMPGVGDKVFSKSSTEIVVGDLDSVRSMPLAPGNEGFRIVRDAALHLASQECMSGIKGFQLKFWNEGKSFSLALPAMKGAIASLPHSAEAKTAIGALSDLRRAVHRLTGDAGQTWVFHASAKQSFALYGRHQIARA